MKSLFAEMKQESSPVGNCKRRTARGTTYPSAIQIWTGGLPPSSPRWEVPHQVLDGGYPHPLSGTGWGIPPGKGHGTSGSGTIMGW